MDIRVKKTKRAIQKAFIALLREKPIEKITVKEIAERAEINKTTFYSHYETLDALTAEIERQTVQLVCDNMGGRTAAAGCAGDLCAGDVCFSPAGNRLPRCRSGISHEPLYTASARCHSGTNQTRKHGTIPI